MAKFAVNVVDDTGLAGLGPKVVEAPTEALAIDQFLIEENLKDRETAARFGMTRFGVIPLPS